MKSLASSLRLSFLPRFLPWLLAWLLPLALVGGLSSAHAQPRPQPGPSKPESKDAKDAKDALDAKDARPAARSDDRSNEQQARAHFQRGQELANQGKYPQAYLEFEAGYRQSHRPLFLFNLGEAARAFGDSGRARAAYQRYLEEDAGGPMVSSAQARLTDLGPGPATDLGLSKKDEEKSSAAPPAPTVLTLPPDRFAKDEPKRESRPLWKKWPFWAAVGGVVAGGVTVYALTRDTSACGDGCTLIDLR